MEAGAGMTSGRPAHGRRATSFSRTVRAAWKKVEDQELCLNFIIPKLICTTYYFFKFEFLKNDSKKIFGADFLF